MFPYIFLTEETYFLIHDSELLTIRVFLNKCVTYKFLYSMLSFFITVVILSNVDLNFKHLGGLVWVNSQFL